MTGSPFDHGQDQELGEALKALLSGNDEAGFVQRVLARVGEMPSGLLPRAPWWEVLGTWARPGLVAAGLGLALGATIWVSGLTSDPQPSTVLGDPLEPPEDPAFPAALLARGQPPDLSEVLVVGLEGR
jgi:hypothetical protein